MEITAWTSPSKESSFLSFLPIAASLAMCWLPQFVLSERGNLPENSKVNLPFHNCTQKRTEMIVIDLRMISQINTADINIHLAHDDPAGSTTSQSWWWVRVGDGDGDKGDKTSLSKAVLKNRPQIQAGPLTFEDLSFWVNLARFYSFSHYAPPRCYTFSVHYWSTRTPQGYSIVINYHFMKNQLFDIMLLQPFALWQHIAIPCNHRGWSSMNGSS